MPVIITAIVAAVSIGEVETIAISTITAETTEILTAATEIIGTLTEAPETIATSTTTAEIIVTSTTAEAITIDTITIVVATEPGIEIGTAGIGTTTADTGMPILSGWVLQPGQVPTITTAITILIITMVIMQHRLPPGMSNGACKDTVHTDHEQILSGVMMVAIIVASAPTAIETVC